MGKQVTPEEKIVRLACVWRIADIADIKARERGDPIGIWHAGTHLYSETNRLREAADEYLKRSKLDHEQLHLAPCSTLKVEP